MNASSCNRTSANLSSEQHDGLLVTLASTGGAAVIICTTAVILVLVKKLYKQLVYRLALYQVLSSLLFASLQVLQLLFLNYHKNPDAYHPLCLITAFLELNSMWINLCSTAWVTLHLFCYATCYRNMRKLECLYIVTSLIVPIIISIIPFTTGSYGRLESWCWIMNARNGCPFFVGIIEQFLLWYVPAFILLSTESVFMIVMIAILGCRVYQKKISSSTGKALKQMLPLTAYPITFFVLIILPFTTRVYGTTQRPPNYGLLVATAFCVPAYSLATGIALILHVVTVSDCKRRVSHAHTYNLRYGTTDKEGMVTDRKETAVSLSSNTKFIPPNETDIDDEAKLI